MTLRTSVTFVCQAVFLVLLLTGCWSSEQDLIPDERAVHPLDGGRNVLMQMDGDDHLLQRRSGEHPVFAVFSPDPAEPAMTVKFFEMVDLFSYIGRKKYLWGFGPNEDGRFLYLYLERLGDDWTLFEKETSMEEAEELSSLEQLVAKVKADRSAERLKPSETDFNLIEIDSTRAAMHRQIATNEFEKERKKKE